MPECARPKREIPIENALKIYVCSSNAGKLRDFSVAAQRANKSNIFVEPLPGLAHISAPAENGATFEENAGAKALYYSAFTEVAVVADDSGLEVDALAGAPGVHSARYSGPMASDCDNNALLLSKLENVSRRKARFVCVLAVARRGELLALERGIVSGSILREPRGEGGFGYDPLFLYPPLDRSFGEMTREEKLAVSHRGNALRELFQRLPSIL